MTITQSTSAPLVVIGGATGNQGGSVLRHLQESDREYRLRALTRDNTKPKAKKLADLGVDVVSIDLKPENKDRIQEAYAGADIVFVSSWVVCPAPSSPCRLDRASPIFGNMSMRNG
jgi:nucleoside-diphosphate-sugar epimerase